MLLLWILYWTFTKLLFVRLFVDSHSIPVASVDTGYAGFAGKETEVESLSCKDS